MYDILDETWEEGAYMEPVNFDLTAPDGFRQLERRAYQNALNVLSDRYDELVGVSLDRLADQLPEDLM